MNIGTQKKILFLDAYFDPEKTAYSHLESDVINMLINMGFQITVICPCPTRGVSEEIHNSYKNKKEEELHNGNLIVKRFNCRREKSNTLSRFLRYLSVCRKIVGLAKKENDVDIIFCNSTPPILGYAASRIKKSFKKRCGKNVKLIYHLQDLFPDSLSAAHLAKERGLLWKIGSLVSNKIYDSSDAIIVISSFFERKLLERGADKSKIKLIYNWIDLDSICRIERIDNRLFDEIGLSREDKIAVYAGNFGLAQNVEVILDAASLLEQKSIKFVLFGYGPFFESIKEKSKQLSNVYVRELLPKNRISEVYSLGNVNIICCKKGFGTASFPSKTWSILACDSFVVASFDKPSELSMLLENEGCGTVVEPGDSNALADAVFEAINNQEVALKTRPIVNRLACKKNCLDLLAEVFHNV